MSVFRSAFAAVRWSWLPYALLALLLAGVGLTMASTNVYALGPCGTSGTFTAPNKCTYLATGQEDIFSVPLGVTMLHVVAVCGKGHVGGQGLGLGGYGDQVTGDISVSGGVLYVEVGGNGIDPIFG